MCRVALNLRQLVKQKLAAAAEEIFELVEKTITEYEEETERQRRLLEQLLQPRVQLHIEDLSEPPHIIKEEQEPEPPPLKEEQEQESLHIKEEQDIIITQVFSGLKTKEQSTASTWDNDPPQTQTETPAEEPVPPSQDEEKPQFYSYTEEDLLVEDEEKRHVYPYTEEDSLPLSYTDEGQLMSPSYTEEASRTFTQTNEEPLSPYFTETASQTFTQNNEEPLPACYTKEEPLSLSYTENSSQTFPQPKEEPENEACSLSCGFCDKEFRHKSLLMTHLRVHTGERPFSCSVCAKSFTRNTHLDRHFLLVHGCENPHRSQKRRYFCVLCNKRCASKLALDKHMAEHEEERAFCCSLCGDRFIRESELVIHLQIHAGQGTSEETVYETLEQNSAASLEDSAGPAGGSTEPQTDRSHHQHAAESNPRQKAQKYVKCPFCCRAVQSTRYSRHIMIHTGEKPFRCSVCGKSFSRKDALTAHMIIHSEDRPFKCSICGISKKRKADIKEHMQTHHRPGGTAAGLRGGPGLVPRRSTLVGPSGGTGVPRGGASAGPSGVSVNVNNSRKKKCPICGKVVVCLKKHLFTHSGERPFSCSICGKRFSRNQHLQRHKDKVHKMRGSFSNDSYEKQSEASIIYCSIDD